MFSPHDHLQVDEQGCLLCGHASNALDADAHFRQKLAAPSPLRGLNAQGALRRGGTPVAPADDPDPQVKASADDSDVAVLLVQRC